MQGRCIEQMVQWPIDYKQGSVHLITESSDTAVCILRAECCIVLHNDAGVHIKLHVMLKLTLH